MDPNETGDGSRREGDPGSPRADRRDPVGAPVVRGDPEVAGDHAEEAEAFDPDDPGSVEAAAETVREFASAAADVDHLTMLRGAAASAALVRGTGSYRAAAELAGEPVTVAFLRKWARVHDLPRSIRRHIANRDIPPSAAKHVARVTGDARFLLAWAILDQDLSVRDVRSIASQVTDGTVIEQALRDHGITPGELTVSLPPKRYRELRRRASLEGIDPDEAVAEAVEQWLASRDGD